MYADPLVEMGSVSNDPPATVTVDGNPNTGFNSAQLRVGGPLRHPAPAKENALFTSATVNHVSTVKEVAERRQDKDGMVLLWILQIMLWIAIAVSVSVTFAVSGKRSTPILLGFLYFGTFVMWVGNIVFTMFSPAAKYLSKVHQTTPSEYAKSIIKSPPTVKFSIRCYHYERLHGRTHGRRGRTAGGDREVVTTHTAEEEVEFHSWDDESLIEVHQTPPSVVRLDLDWTLLAADQETADQIAARYQQFVAKNTRDEHQDHGMIKSVAGIPADGSVLLLTRETGGKGLDMLLLILFAVFAMSVPYQMFFFARSSRAKLSFTKAITMRPAGFNTKLVF